MPYPFQVRSALSWRPTPKGVMVVSIDPGVTTGIAVIGDDGSVVDTWSLSDPEDVSDQLRVLASMYPDADSVGEQPPLWGGHHRPHTQVIEEKVKHFFPDVDWVNPGQWKGHPASKTSDLRGKTQHEKDAAGLGRWYRATRRHTSVGGAGTSEV